MQGAFNGEFFLFLASAAFGLWCLDQARRFNSARFSTAVRVRWAVFFTVCGVLLLLLAFAILKRRMFFVGPLGP